jgi:hypothetical protein
MMIHVYWFLIENGIGPSGFLQCDVEDFDDIGLTKFGKKQILKIFAKVKGIIKINHAYTHHQLSIFHNYIIFYSQTLAINLQGIQIIMFVLILQIVKLVWTMVTTAAYTRSWRLMLPSGGISGESWASERERWTTLIVAQGCLQKLQWATSEYCWVSGCSGPLEMGVTVQASPLEGRYELHS